MTLPQAQRDFYRNEDGELKIPYANCSTLIPVDYGYARLHRVYDPAFEDVLRNRQQISDYKFNDDHVKVRFTNGADWSFITYVKMKWGGSVRKS